MEQDSLYNGKLEAMEIKLYDRMEALVNENRFADACQIADLMGKLGIV